MKLVKEKRLIQVFNNSRYDPSTHKVVHDEDFEMMDTITKDNIDDVRNFLDKAEYITTEVMPENSKVYFDPTVEFPRRKFGTIYPTCKLVNSIDKADVVVVDKRKLATTSSMYMGTKRYTPIADEKFQYTPYAKNPQPATGPSIELFVCDHDHQLAKVNIINRACELVMHNKTIIDIKNVNVGTEDLSDEAIDRLDLMFKSNTNDMINLAMRMLTAYNYEKEKLKIVTILHNNWQNWYGCQKKPSVETKSLLRKVELDYPGFNVKFGLQSFQFWFKLALEHPDNRMIEEQICKITEEQLHGVPKFKIIPYEGDRTTSGESTDSD